MRVFVHREPYGRFVSCLVFVPRDRYTTPVRLRIAELLVEAFGATELRVEHPPVRVGARPPALRVAASTRPVTPNVDVDTGLEAPRGGGGSLVGRRPARHAGRARAARRRASTCSARGAARSRPRTRRTFTADRRARRSHRARSRSTRRRRAGARGPARRQRRLPRPQALRHSARSRRSPTCCPGSPTWASPSTTSGRTRSRPPGSSPAGSSTSGCARPADAVARRVRPLRGDVPRGARAAKPKTTPSTDSCCAPGCTWREVALLRAYSRYLRQVGTPFSQTYIATRSPRTRHRAPPGRAVRRPPRPAAPVDDRRSSADTDAIVAEITERARRGHEPRRGPHPPRAAAPRARDTAHQLVPDRRRRRAPSVSWCSSSTPRRSPTCRSRGRCSSCSCTRRASKACTCAPGASLGAASAGRTGAKTSAPRCSA